MNKILLPHRIPFRTWLKAAGFVLLLLGWIFVIGRYEWIGSIAMLLIGAAATAFGALACIEENQRGRRGFGFGFIAFAILLFAVFGCWIDAPGNPIYNQPLEKLFCPAGTDLTRSPVRRRKMTFQRFRCVDGDGRIAHEIAWYATDAARFAEYVLLGGAFVALATICARAKRRAAATTIFVDWKTPLKPRKKD